MTLPAFALSMGLVVVVLTGWVWGWSAYRRGETPDSDVGCVMPLFAWIPAIFLYLLPGLAVVLLARYLWATGSGSSLPSLGDTTEIFLPAAKFGFLFCVAGNFSDLSSLLGVPKLRRHLAEFLLVLPFAYYAMIGLSLLVARIMTALAPSYFWPPVRTSSLLALPGVVPDPVWNLGLLVLLVGVCAVGSHPLRKNRAAAGARPEHGA